MQTRTAPRQQQARDPIAVDEGDPLGASDLRDPLAVQAMGALTGPEPVATAAQGVAGSGGPLPHGDTIQRSFGRHDVSAVRAHTDGAARAASASLGAEAYATGDRVAFAGTPSLHTAAHEAAHVVQQRAGVSLKGGVGQQGDPYERHADAVADRVVQGRSAEGLLDGLVPAGGFKPAVQRKPAMAIDKSNALETIDDATGTTIEQHAIKFGNVNADGVGTGMSGWLYPGSKIVYGGAPSVEPAWWTQMHVDAEKAKKGASAWISKFVVQGHLLNDNLGGPGNDMRNLTPIAKGCNSHHSAKVESDVKGWVAGGSIAKYEVYPVYKGAGPDAAWFGNQIPAAYLKKFPRTLKIVHGEYDGKTRKEKQVFDTEITNAISGQ